ncbi:MAG TPA: TRP-like protein [Polyangiaceae bacterium]|nr:TRP-like protein [Polyangiaceae bacterium]
MSLVVRDVGDQSNLALELKPSTDSNAALVRSDVLVLLREKRYEEALARLYQARADTPGSVEVQRGIDQVKEFLIGAYAKRLGGLDKIAKPSANAAGRSPDVVLLSRYIDGLTTYGDLAEICPLGRMRTLQVLIEMYAPKSSASSSGDQEAHSGPRALLQASEPQARVEITIPVEEPAPQTARSGPPPPPSASAPASAQVDDSPEAREYRAAFGRGTAAFIQSRFADAVEAFQACAALRPGDAAAEVMLRRARHDLESRV